MSPGLRLGLLPLLIAGCAHPLLVVPDSDWQMVPAPQRAAIDRQHEADVVTARAELKVASAGLADAQRSQPAQAAPATPGAPPKPDPDADPWMLAVHDHDQARVAAHARVDEARTTWLRTRLIFRQRQVDAASARLDLLVCDRELTRARAIDHSLLGTDHYDSAPLQGQLSRAQRRWHVAATGARQARAEFERASTTIASAKEAYAQLMRSGPVHLAMPLPGMSDERPRLELTAWTVTRTDIGRRRGLRHWLDVAAQGPPQLRKREFRLRPVPRTPQAEIPRAPTPVAAPAPAHKAAPSEKPWDVAAEASPGAKPWDFAEPARPDAAARPGKPLRPSASPASATTAAATPKPGDRPSAALPGQAPGAGKPELAAPRPQAMPATTAAKPVDPPPPQAEAPARGQ